MYAPFFGLTQEPFSIAPDPRFLFMSDMHREALAHLLYGVSGGGGFVLLTGEIGAGKTTVCRCFLEQVPGDCNVAYIVNPKLTVVELLKTVCDEFGIDVPGRAGVPPSVKDYLDPLNRFVLDAHAAGRNNLLVIDEAQSLSADVLEQLRLLTNLETAERKLLQIVLIGQPELRDMLAQPGLEQLAQRVIARYHLPALSEAGTALYVQHRLSVAGLRAEGVFDRAALRRVHQLTGGVPRRINLLCGRAMLGAYAHGQRRIGRPVVETAAREVFDRRGHGSPAAPGRWLAAGGGLLAGAVIVGAGFIAWQGRGDEQVGAALTGAAPPAASLAASAVAAAPPASAVVAVPAASTPASAVAPDIDALPSVAPTAAPAVALADEAQAWRELAGLWGVTPDAGEPCEAAARQGLQCFRGTSGLALIRQLDRPAIVALREGASRQGYALLVGVSEEAVQLRLQGGQVQSVPLTELARIWRGEFATLWRAPPGYADGLSNPPGRALAGWLAPRLPAPAQAASGVGRGAALQSQVQAFQLTQGLKPDGLVGPLTLMQINRASGVPEPRLQTGR